MDGPSSPWAGLTFYHQKRMDGGLRTGVLLGETTVLGSFLEGAGDYDPTLIWSVDLRVRGEGLPETTDEARRWLLENESVLREGLRRYADSLSAGSDPTGPYLMEWSDFPGRPEGTEMEIAVGALRRVDARTLASVVRRIQEHWGDLIKGLAPITAVVQ